ncbi:penicillin-insensitive murein endopeptidase [Jannaschia sp. LMIT008]|uniref:penicillin-insensitive murein endopeptidase n=1 Tax=Jannaschia maritima TaxID=3032585 RepID=UPI002811BDF3|nr:penicillin-insensitive murein endopeptidase [Jannaschia sp. LMIT008]
MRLAALLTACALLAGCVADDPVVRFDAAQTVQATRDDRVAKPLFEAVTRPTEGGPAAFGGHSRGCAAGSVPLAETGPTWQAMRLSRNRFWGHPQMVDMVQDLSRAAVRAGWAGLYVGDLSLPRGGPVSGHASHQIGLDADVWLYPVERLNLTRAERESLSAVSMRRASGAYVNDRWTQAHMQVVKAAASDPRTTRIFIFPGAKVAMCDAETGDRSWLRKVRPWYGHHYHMHIRIACPRGARGCVDQDPPPPGDGCAEARQWQANILNPPPPDPNAPAPRPRRDLTMADLPGQCAAVLASPSR